MRDCFSVRSAKCQPDGGVLCCGEIEYDSTRYRCTDGTHRVYFDSRNTRQIYATFFFITRSEINPVLKLLACQQIYEMYASPVNFAVNLTLSALATSDTIAADL